MRGSNPSEIRAKSEAPEQVDDRSDAWVGQADQGGEVTTGGLTPHG
jgi:hypothetical protein